MEMERDGLEGGINSERRRVEGGMEVDRDGLESGMDMQRRRVEDRVEVERNGLESGMDMQPYRMKVGWKQRDLGCRFGRERRSSP